MRFGTVLHFSDVNTGSQYNQQYVPSWGVGAVAGSSSPAGAPTSWLLGVLAAKNSGLSPSPENLPEKVWENYQWWIDMGYKRPAPLPQICGFIHFRALCEIRLRPDSSCNHILIQLLPLCASFTTYRCSSESSFNIASAFLTSNTKCVCRRDNKCLIATSNTLWLLHSFPLWSPCNCVCETEFFRFLL